jgi:ribosome-associated heat shock protein Hsp15
LPGKDAQRIDKWLFFARVVKSRSLAAKLVSEGRVRINREKVTKPASGVNERDIVTIAIHDRIRVLKILGFSSRRGPASEAGLLYEELSAAQKQVPKS